MVCHLLLSRARFDAESNSRRRPSGQSDDSLAKTVPANFCHELRIGCNLAVWYMVEAAKSSVLGNSAIAPVKEEEGRAAPLLGVVVALQLAGSSAVTLLPRRHRGQYHQLIAEASTLIGEPHIFQIKCRCCCRCRCCCSGLAAVTGRAVVPPGSICGTVPHRHSEITRPRVRRRHGVLAVLQTWPAIDRLYHLESGGRINLDCGYGGGSLRVW
jgi:hypothetical protein